MHARSRGLVLASCAVRDGAVGLNSYQRVGDEVEHVAAVSDGEQRPVVEAVALSQHLIIRKPVPRNVAEKQQRGVDAHGCEWLT